jgi:hypothetical protein
MDCLRADVPVYDDDGNGCYSWMSVRAGQDSKFCGGLEVGGDLTVGGTIIGGGGGGPGGMPVTSVEIECTPAPPIPAGTPVDLAIKDVNDNLCVAAGLNDFLQENLNCTVGGPPGVARVEAVAQLGDKVNEALKKVVDYFCEKNNIQDTARFYVGASNQPITNSGLVKPITAVENPFMNQTGTFSSQIINGAGALCITKKGIYEAKLNIQLGQPDGTAHRFYLCSTTGNTILPGLSPGGGLLPPGQEFIQTNWVRLIQIQEPEAQGPQLPILSTMSDSQTFIVTQADLDQSTQTTPGGEKCVVIQAFLQKLTFTLQPEPILLGVAAPLLTGISGSANQYGYWGTSWSVSYRGDTPF